MDVGFGCQLLGAALVTTLLVSLIEPGLNLNPGEKSHLISAECTLQPGSRLERCE